ncbi:Clp protease N-terminal domain-containing protein [Streptomyces gamaensis]|uniref:Clp protease N-terminal domain-containing protein n=1 Tax=Streptomyces gamaensis TaxID=1763542 RepID=A0ABW0Z6A1_9ACTN
MQRRTRDTGPVGTDHEGRHSAEQGHSAELASALAGARRRALRDGDRQIDTAHLLHALLEADPETCRAVAGDDPAVVVRLLGYLVQRTIGYGLRWSGTVEDSGALPVLRGGRAPGFSPAAAAALEGACLRARSGGPVRGTDLLAALVGDRRCRAVEVLGRAGVDAGELLARLDGRPASGADGRWRA